MASETLIRWRWRLQRPRLVRGYLAAHAVAKLNLGAGTSPLDGWLNADLQPGRPGIVFLDVREPFPLPGGAFRFVFSEHLIEHLSLDEGLACLREAFRVLEPGGRIRIATPSLEQLVSLFAPEQSPEQRAYVEWATDTFLPGLGVYAPGFVLNNFFRSWGHRFVHDRTTLAWALERAGFVEVAQVAPGESGVPELAGLEAHAGVIGEAANRFETMVLEAARP